MEDEGHERGSSDFGTLLRSFRLAAGLSQETLAERARVSLRGISALERGYRRTPQRETLALLTEALALSGDERRVFEAAAARPSLPRRRGETLVTVGPWRDVAVSLPLSLTTFIGRDAEIADITGLIRNHRFVTITGAGGVGKTQTALRVASALQNDDFGRIAFVPLAPLGSPAHVVPAIAAAVGVQEVAQRPLRETLLAYLRNRKLLLVIDNAEHLIEEAARVVETLLQGALELRVLATSRVAFKTGGERIYRLPSLALDDAVSLFVDRARAIDFHFTLTDSKAHKVTDLCRRLGSIPLAIELAAARVDSLSIDAIGQHLEEHFVSASAASQTPTRQQTMRAAIAWSYNLLSDSERRVFERLSVFAGGGTLAAVTIVCTGDEIAEADVCDLIASLVTKSLLVADLEHDEPRYLLLEPFRAYAGERLSARGEENAIARRHASACLERADRYINAYENGPVSVSYSIAHGELDNWRAALDWTLIERHDIPLGQQIAGKLRGPWNLSGRLIEGLRWTELALGLVEDGTAARVVANLEHTRAYLSHQLQDMENAIAAGHRALAVFRATKDLTAIAKLGPMVGNAYRRLGLLREGKPLVEEGLAAARQVNSASAISYALRVLAGNKFVDGDRAGARRDGLEALRIAQERRDYAEVVVALFDLAACSEDDLQLALEYSTRAIELSPFPARLDVLAQVLNLVSICSFLLKRHDEAIAKARDALNLEGSHDVPLHSDEAMQTIATVAVLAPEACAGDRASNAVRAARLLAFTYDRGFSYNREPSEQMTIARDKALGLLGDTMGKNQLERLLAEGSAMSRERAISEALALCG